MINTLLGSLEFRRGGVFAHVWSYGLGNSIGDPCAVDIVGVGDSVLALGRPDAHRSGLLRG